MAGIEEVMRMTNGKQKGKRGELEFARLCRANGYEVRRTAQYCGNTGEAADCIGLPGIHIEVKRVEHLNIDDALDQARRDAEAKHDKRFMKEGEEMTHNEWKPARPTEPASKPGEKSTNSEFFDEHYDGRIQPIELMQAQMSHSEFRGFLLGNIIKYASRMGKKDSAVKDAVKIARYADWLVQHEKKYVIDPRK